MNPDNGEIKRNPTAEELKAYTVGLSEREAAYLRYVRKTERVAALAKRREEHPIKFSQKHKRHHR
jgi:hypothetical protein